MYKYANESVRVSRFKDTLRRVGGCVEHGEEVMKKALWEVMLADDQYPHVIGIARLEVCKVV